MEFIKDAFSVYLSVLKSNWLFCVLWTAIMVTGSAIFQLSVLHSVSGFIVACSIILGMYVLLFLVNVGIGIYYKVNNDV